MRLTRKRIIVVAMALIERDGAEAFSMGRLATELGCSVMLLYGYVPSRSDLLDCVADQVLARVAAAEVPACSWEDQVRALAASIRQVAQASPRCATLAFGRRSVMSMAAAPVVGALRGAGLSGQDATAVAATLTAYVIGSALCEPARADADADFEFGLGMLIGSVAALCPAAAKT
jgi:AcrR family transcriptional regulator